MGQSFDQRFGLAIVGLLIYTILPSSRHQKSKDRSGAIQTFDTVTQLPVRNTIETTHRWIIIGNIDPKFRSEKQFQHLSRHSLQIRLVLFKAGGIEGNKMKLDVECEWHLWQLLQNLETLIFSNRANPKNRNNSSP